MIAALLLAMASLAPEAEPVRVAVVAADRALERAGSCVRSDADEREFDALSRRHAEIATEAEGLFGRAGTQDFGDRYAGRRPRCRAVRSALGDVRRLLDTAAAALAEQTARMPGLWLGTIRICGAAMQTMEDEDRSGVVLTLPPDAHDALASETAARVGLPLSLRANGRLIISPRVNEPITGGSVYITNDGDAAELTALLDPALRVC